MLKFLRKYNTWILVIGGSLLMLTFLAPQAIQRLGQDMSNRTEFRIGDERVRAMDLALAQRELSALKAMPWTKPLFELLPIGRSAEHWILLTHEAERGGFVGGPEDGRTFLEALVRQEATQFGATPEVVQQALEQVRANLPRLAGEYRMTETEFLESMARLRGIDRLMSAHLFPGRVSDRRAIAAAKEAADAAIADYVIVPASALADRQPEPTDADLQAHFEQYKDVRPGEGDLGLGYLLPPRVKLEWLTLDRSAIESAVRVDPVEIRKRYREQHPDDPQATGFAEVRRTLEEEYRRSQVDRVMKVAEQTVRAELLAALQGVPRQGAYRVLPEGWSSRRPSLAKIRDDVVAAVRTETGVEIPAPSVTVRGAEWLTASDLAALPGIGQSFAQLGAVRVPFVQVVFGLKELGGEGTLPVQAGLTVEEPMRDRQGNAYFMTVLEARTESPPASWEEERERLEADWRALRAYEGLKSRVEEFETLAASEGLEAVLRAAGLPLDPLSVSRSSQIRAGSVVPSDQRIRSAEFPEAVVSASRSIDPTRPIDETPVAERTVAAAMPRSLAVGVAVITRSSPVTAELFRVADREAVNLVIREEFPQTEGENPLSLESLVRRLDARMPSGEPLKVDDEG